MKDALAATQASAQATRGETEDASSTAREGYTLNELDIQMGLAQPKAEAKWSGSTYSVPALTPTQARALLASQEKGAAK